MSRYTKTQVTQLSANEQAAIDNINKNFSDIQEAINDTVSRSGNTPTHMTHDLDMNGKRIINVPAPLSDTDLVRRQDVVGDIALVQSLVNATTNAAAQTLKAAADVQEIIQDQNVGLVADDLGLGENSKIRLCGTNIDDIKDVADNLSDIQTVNSNKENIDAVAGNETNINAVNANKANIDSCASNMSAITGASTQAANAANSALSASGSATSSSLSAQKAQEAALSVTGFDLFDHKWEDHLLSDMNWLRADTFSWQDGTVYTDAYDHLVSDYNGGTSQTETVGSYTITYVLATDGHKITTDETNVANIYNESGVAWYYVLDTANTRFKLPRENPAREELIQVIRAKGNGIALGLTNGSQYGAKVGNGYYAYESIYGKAVGTADSCGNFGGGAIGITTDSTKSGIISSTTDSTSVYKGKKYLYFYVGQYSQSATEQTAGLNAELFNGKADVDLNNVSAGIDFVVESYKNGTEWYRLYKSGWVEQGGFVNSTGTDYQSQTVNLLVEMADSNYNVSVTPYTNYANTMAAKGFSYFNKTTTSFTVAPQTSSITVGNSWEVKGVSLQS